MHLHSSRHGRLPGFRQCCCLALVSMLLFSGCASTRVAPPQADSQAQQKQVEERLAEILNAAETRDFSRLDSYHWYGEKFTKFGSGPGKRLDAEAAREGEHNGLRAATGLKLRADDLKVDVFGGTAVATFILTASFQAGAEPVTKHERGTLVLVRKEGSWKIVHEHFSAAQ
jgi:ketosteroid isomerase-like protein